MTVPDGYPSIRECAQVVIEAIGRGGEDLEAFRAEIYQALKPFVGRPDLFSLGVKRPGNHIDNSKYVYYDGELSITIDQLPQVWSCRRTITAFGRRCACSRGGCATSSMTDWTMVPLMDTPS